MLHSVTVMMFVLVLLMTSLALVQCKAVLRANSLQTQHSLNGQIGPSKSRQFLLLTGVGRETTTPDFIRLVLMRFIYGLASTMGVEDRLEDVFNGVFVPPNADSDFFGFGDFDDTAGGGDAGDFDEAALEGIFSDDVF